jgi:hypothetical protein
MLTPDRLIPAEALEPNRAELVRRIDSLDLHLTVDIKADDEAARALAWSLMFEHWPELADEELDAAQRFYNRYFWFVRFVALYQMTNGPDAGLEQQAYQLFEEVETLQGLVDLDVLQEVDALARRVQ